VLNRADVALFGAISDYWTRFAAEGNPNRDDAHWRLPPIEKQRG
jgi:hypothetical protein